MAMTLNAAFCLALSKRGYVKCLKFRGRKTKYLHPSGDPDKSVYVGTNGSLRYGKTHSDSVVIPQSVRDSLYREAISS